MWIDRLCYKNDNVPRSLWTTSTFIKPNFRAEISDLSSNDPLPPLTNLDVLRFLILRSRGKMGQNYQRTG